MGEVLRVLDLRAEGCCVTTCPGNAGLDRGGPHYFRLDFPYLRISKMISKIPRQINSGQIRIVAAILPDQEKFRVVTVTKNSNSMIPQNQTKSLDLF